MHVVKLFTNPPRPYPYVLINVMRPKFSPLRHAEEAIIDSGVEIFRDPSIRDYPGDHASRLIRVYIKARSIMRNKPIYVTCPDYPDDYHPGSLWISNDYTNIERTVDNVLKYTEKYRNIPWLIPIQGWNKRPESVLRCIKLYKEHGIIDKFDYFAVGNLCVEPDVKVIYETIRLVRGELPDKRVHVFGLKLSALRMVFHMIDSFDTMAWTRPVDSSLRVNHSCKTKEERIRFFERWLEKYGAIIRTETLDAFIADKKGGC
jgi:glycosyltransferase involved in cell wall biosynthesis